MKKYFIKNSNLLEEINNSKITYCCYTDKKYTKYDIICDGYDLVTPNLIDNFFKKNKDKDEVIIRIMTEEHILPYISYKGSKVNLQDVKMSPFKHFVLSRDDYNKVIQDYQNSLDIIETYNNKIIDIKNNIKEINRDIRFKKLSKESDKELKVLLFDNEREIKNIINLIKNETNEFSNNIKKYMKEVLRSHWKGETIETGSYCIDQGKLTDNLVYMLITLVDQYAKSGNWCGYSWLEDMKSAALVQLCEVVLKFEESKSNNAFAYLTQIVSMKFISILNGEKTQTRIKSQLLKNNGYDATYNEAAELEYNISKEYFEEDQKKIKELL